MVNETDAPAGGGSEEAKEVPVRASNELTLNQDRSSSDPEESHNLRWLRMDPDLSRTVLAKTEEELLGTLSALMRNKVEHEKAQRSLAHTLLEIQGAKDEVAAVKRQVRAAEDELNARLNDHSRTVEEIDRVQFQLQEERAKYLQSQDELIALKGEIEKTRGDLSAATFQLAELKQQQAAAQTDIERTKAEVTAIQEKRQVALDQLHPLENELAERLAAREAIIEQVTMLDRHVAELTGARDIQTNAQRIALVSHGTESMRGQINQLKDEIERIEKERVRLAAERDRVEAEFAALEGRLNSARHSYAETLERLDEARTALAFTEKEHEKAVSKLGQVQETKTESEPPVIEPVVTEPAEVPEAQASASSPPTEAAETALSQASEPPVVEAPVEETALPLLLNEPLPAIASSWDSYRLESEFFTDETLDANRVVQLVTELPGIESALIVRQRGAVLAGELPLRISDQLRAPDRDYEELFRNWPNRVGGTTSEQTQSATHQIGHEFLTSIQVDDLFLLVSHESPKLHPGVAEKLTVVAEELAKMYGVHAGV